MDVLIVFLALVLLMYLAYRGITLLILAPGIAVLTALVTGGLPVLAAYTQIFMSNMGDFIIAFFPLFLLGAIFGKLMDDSGSATAIANTVIRWLGPEQAILAVVLCCAVLTYGGVSLFVVAFAIYPIAASLFRDADIPKRLIPASLALGSFSFTMSALPGSPAIQNAIPMPFFGTTAFAAPGLGIIAALIMLAFGMWWLNRQRARAGSRGEGYGEHDDAVPESDLMMREGAVRDGYDIRELPLGTPTEAAPPSFPAAIAPVVAVVLVNLLFIQFVVPAMDTTYLAQPKFGATDIDAVRGVWAIIVALVAAILLIVGLNWSRLTRLQASLDEGANASVLPIAATASLVGFGAVIAALPAFEIISDALLALGDLNPLVSLAVAVNLLSAITGSASGGMSIALETLGPTYVQLAEAQNISLEAMHRVTSIASGTLDVLPHNGAVITVLSICKLDHRQAYGDIFMAAIVGPLIALIAVILLASLFGGF
nr:GntP family permease [Dichotomicrobium thermohalophilum]